VEKSKRTVSASTFIGVIAANVDNIKLSDWEFRTFIRNTLPIVKYTGAVLTQQCSGQETPDEIWTNEDESAEIEWQITEESCR